MILNNSGKDFVLTNIPFSHGLDMIGGITSLPLGVFNVDGVAVVVLVSSMLFVSMGGSVTVKFSGTDSEIDDDEEEEDKGAVSLIVSNMSDDSDTVSVSFETFCAGDRSPERFVVDSCGISSKIDSLRFKAD